MAKKGDIYKKYQVYFFLYLAVICELLIVIVERDDAEESLLIKQRELERKNRAIILELLKNMPAVAAAGDNQLKVNESRSFTIRVKGLGEKDEVTAPPIVHVYKEGVEVQTIRYSKDMFGPNFDVYAIHDSTLQSTTGERLFRFTWKADRGAGQFEFHVDAGTNRIELRPDVSQKAKIKVGSLEFKRDEIQSAIDYDPNLRGTPIEFYIRKSESLDPAKFIVDVISEAYDQLQILAENTTTAVGFDAFNEIKVRGTTTDKVNYMDPVGGGVCLDPRNPRNPFKTDDPTRGKWVWTGRFNEPGQKTITVSARDNRGAGALSVARPVTFTVNIKQPFLRRKQPRAAYAGEMFNMNVDVHGLDVANAYAWKLEMDNQTILDSVGPAVRYFIPDGSVGKSMKVKATYDDRMYSWMDSAKHELNPSELEYKISAPVDQVYPLFEGDTQYPQNFEFSFEAYRCGICIKANEKSIAANEINVEAVKSSGGSLPVNWIPQPLIDRGREVATKVTFRIGGRVSNKGEMVLIKITAGQATEEITVKLKGS